LIADLDNTRAAAVDPAYHWRELENVLLVDFSPTRRTCARQRPRCLMIVDMLPPLRAPDVQNACTVPCICARECAAACSKPASGKAANPARVAPFLEVR